MVSLLISPSAIGSSLTGECAGAFLFTRVGLRSLCGLGGDIYRDDGFDVVCIDAVFFGLGADLTRLGSTLDVPGSDFSAVLLMNCLKLNGVLSCLVASEPLIL